MAHQLNCSLQPLKRWFQFQLNLTAKMNAFASVKIHHSNATHSVLGKKRAICSTIRLFLFIKLYFSHEIAFIYSSQASSFNCEMSDLDQSELKSNVHFARTNDRDYWLFSWVYDYTCRDKVATIGGSNRANNDRRMDIFREKDGKRKIYELCT